MRTVIYSPDSKLDLTAIFDYLNTHSLTASEALADHIDKKTSLLAAHPGIGRDRGELIEGLRSIVVGNYVLFFRAGVTQLEIVRVLHGNRDIDSIFHQL